MANNIAYGQMLSDKLNEKFNPLFFSAPGKDEITIIEDSNPLNEYKVLLKDGEIDQFKNSYCAKKPNPAAVIATKDEGKAYSDLTAWLVKIKKGN